MGMGNYACDADVVGTRFIREMCPKKWASLMNILIENHINLDVLGAAAQYIDDMVYDLAQQIEWNTDNDYSKCEEIAERIVKAYEELCKSFQKATGLSLYLNYHSAEDRGDEVDGYFWSVGGVYIYSPAGEKYKKEITHKSWTIYG